MTARAPVPHLTHPKLLRRARGRLGRLVEAVTALVAFPMLLAAGAAAFLASRTTMAVGVRVRTDTRSGPPASAASLAGTAFMVGITERGSTTDPIEVRSMGDVRRKLGDRVTYGTLDDQLLTAFEEARPHGLRVFVARVVGAAAVTATRTSVDRAGVPVDTVRWDAVSLGEWGNALNVQVIAGTAADTVTVVVTHDTEGEVSRRENLASPAAIVAAFAEDDWLRAVDLGSPTVAPNNLPAIDANPVTLALGADDRASITADDYVAALARFGPRLGTGLVAIPGQPYTAVGAGIRAHVDANRRIGVVATGPGASQATARAAASTANLESDAVGVAWPHVRIPDGNGGVRTISPEGAIAGRRARTMREVGPWQPPAGEYGILQFVVGVEQEVTDAEVDELDDAKVSVIRTLPTASGRSSTRIYGWNSTSDDRDNYEMLSGRDTLNLIHVAAEETLEKYVLRAIDGRGHLLSDMNADLVGIVAPIRRAGGLYERIDPGTGDVLDPGYAVDTSATVNPIEELAAGRVHAIVSARISPVGKLIDVTIVKAALTAAV